MTCLLAELLLCAHVRGACVRGGDAYLATANAIISAELSFVDDEPRVSPLLRSRSGTRLDPWVVRLYGYCLLAAFSCSQVKSRGMSSSVTNENKYRVMPQPKMCMISTALSLTMSLSRCSDAKWAEKIPVAHEAGWLRLRGLKAGLKAWLKARRR